MNTSLYRLRFPSLLPCITLLSISLFTGNVLAQEGCKYLELYFAPLQLPVQNRPNMIVGPGPGDVEKRLVGPEECRIVGEKIIKNAHGVPYRQVTIGISGTVFGFAPVNPKAMPPLGSGADGEGRANTFTDHAFIWQTEGTMGPFVPGTGHYKYSEEVQVGVEILIPQNPADWNGSMWVLAHGAGRFPPLKFPPREAGKFNRHTETSESAGALMDMGFAVVWTRRDSSSSDEGSMAVANTVTLDDGTELGGPGKLGMGFNDHLGLMRDYTVISRNYVIEQLGKAPEALFYRGHSAGGALGRSFLIAKGMNSDHEGKKLFDGFYLDDSAGGRGASAYFWESEMVDEHGSFALEVSDVDQLTFDAEHRQFMSPVIEVVHAAYTGSRTSTVPQLFERVTATYPNYKRENARINLEKGLGDIWKSYEIAGVSHGDSASDAEDYPELARDMVDIGGVAIALEQALADWVLKGKQPPHIRVDAKDVWDLDKNAGPAIQLPDTACPRGIYRPFMKRPDGTSVGPSPALFIPYLTELVPQINEDMPRPVGFKEEWLEPLNEKGYLVDMSGGAGQRMTRPTIQQAWIMRYKQGEKTGILKPDERLTRERYVECVTDVASSLRADGLLTAEAERWYIEKSKTDAIGVD